MKLKQVVTLLTVIAILWLGLILGISFIATPVKFLAKSLTLPVALDVGRQTFRALNLLELLLTVAVIFLSLLTQQRRIIISSLIIALIIILQSFWVLPALDLRVEIIIQGGSVEKSNLHNLYIALEILKLFVLIYLVYSNKHIIIRE